MTLHTPPCAALVALLLAADLVPSSGAAFANVKEGDLVPDSKLPLLDGKGKEQLLGKGEVSLFLFFRPGQEHSRATLEALGVAQKTLKGKPVHWSAVVSDRYGAAEVTELVRATGFKGSVLVDPVDTLYGTFGVDMHPCLGVASADQRLLFYQPFTKINFADVILARVRFALGESTRDEMERVVNPPPATQGGQSQVSRRFFKLGEKLYRAKDWDKAMDSAKKCLENDPEGAACHGLLAAVLAAKGSCAEAKTAAENALATDPRNPLALEARAACPK